MQLTLTAPWASKKALTGIAGVTVMVVLFLVLGHASRASKPLLFQGIPIPFAVDHANLQGSITRFGKRNNIDVLDVTYNNGEHKEILYQDRIYLVHIPDNDRVLNMPLDLAIALTGSGTHLVDYYGYRYSDAAATMERRDIFALRFSDRFPGQFFASQTARNNDPLFGNALANFESSNRVKFHPTAPAADGVRMDPNGALYVFIVNTHNGADLSVDGVMGCGNTAIDFPEECDDGNFDNTDLCRTDCTFGTPIPFGSGAAKNTNIKIRQLAQASIATALAGSGSISLLRFSASAADLTQLQHTAFSAQTGSLSLLQHYKLWQDTNSDGVVDQAVTIAKSPVGGRVTFDSPLDWSGALLNSGTLLTFELRADASPSFSGTSLLRAQFATDLPDYIGGRRINGTFPIFGIRTNGLCTQTGCQISVQTVLGTLWTITDGILPPPPPSTVTVQTQTSVDEASASASQTGITLFRFSVGPSTGAILSDLTLHAVSGSLSDAHHFVLWRDTNNDGVVDTPVQQVQTGSLGFVVFHGTGALRTVQANQTAIFEVKADVVDSPAGADIAVQFAVAQTYIGFLFASNPANSFSGIDTNGLCTAGPCAILVTAHHATHWTFIVPVCGNGVKEAAEACDDGALVNGDGCSSTCTVESGFACTGTAPSVCDGICGDGIIKGSEECDDGNQINTDDCDNTCHLTTPTPTFP